MKAFPIAVLLSMTVVLLACGLPSVDLAYCQDETQADSQEDAKKDPKNKVIRSAIDAARNDDIDKALEIIDAFESEEIDFQVSMLTVQLLTMKGQQVSETDRHAANSYMYRAAKILRVMAGEGVLPNDAKSSVAVVIYNEASCFAIDDKPDQAMKSLAEAFDWGFDDVNHLAGDEDFKSLSDKPEFKKFLEEQRVLIAERLRKATKAELDAFQSFDFDFALTSVAGKDLSLSDYQGKVVIVDFWGTWCPPCIAEIPSFVKLKNTLGSKGLEIVGLNYEHGEDDEENIEKIKKSMEELEMNYDCALLDEKTMEQVPDLTGFPTTLFVDRNGKVRLMLVGLHKYSKLESIVTQLLEEKASN